MMDLRFLKLVVISVLSFVLVVEGAGVIARPRNTCVVRGANATFEITVEPPRPDPRLVFRLGQQNIGTDDESYDPDQYRITESPENTFQLVVLNANADDASVDMDKTDDQFDTSRFYGIEYQALTDGSFAQLIIIENEPECELKAGQKFDDIMEGDRITLTCSLRYYGQWAPIMDWKSGTNNILRPTHTDQDGLLQYQLNFPPATPLDQGRSVMVTTRFSTPPAGLIPAGSTGRTYSKRAPTFERRYLSKPSMNVWYKVRDVTVSPGGREHHVGNTLTCMASGRPDPKVRWVDSRTNEELSSTGELRLTQDMLGSQSYACLATNTIRNVPYNDTRRMDINVTPQLETTTSVTSPPDPRQTSNAGGLNGGEIAGIVIGVLVFLIIIFVLLFFCCVRRSPDTKKEKKGPPPPLAQPDHIRNMKSGDNLSYISDKTPSYTPSPYYSNQMAGPPYETSNIVYADLALDDTPRSRKPIQTQIFTDV